MNANAIRLRSGTLDSLRGLTLFSMIAYHLCWDLVYLRGLPWAWYNGFWAYIWQQSICCTFILLSGYCWQMGRHPLRRGLMSFCGGLAGLSSGFVRGAFGFHVLAELAMLAAAVLLALALGARRAAAAPA